MSISRFQVDQSSWLSGPGWLRPLVELQCGVDWCGLCPAQVAETFALLFFPFLCGIHLPHDVQRFVSPLECDMLNFKTNNDKLSSPLNPLTPKTQWDNGYCVSHRPLTVIMCGSWGSAFWHEWKNTLKLGRLAIYILSILKPESLFTVKSLEVVVCWSVSVLFPQPCELVLVEWVWFIEDFEFF